jgi:hypothetical protein
MEASEVQQKNADRKYSLVLFRFSTVEFVAHS